MGNLITAIVKAYRPIKGFNKLVNLSRMINSYSVLLDLIYIGLNYGIFINTNQLLLLHIMTGSALIKILGAFIVQIKQSVRFMYSIVLITIALIIIFVLLFVIMVRLGNVFSICRLLSNYYNKYPDLDNSIIYKCNKQKIYYFTWLGMQLVLFVTGGIEIRFDYIAHDVLKKKRRKKKKDNNNENNNDNINENNNNDNINNKIN